MICSSEKRFFTSNLLALGNWTPDRSATQNWGDVAPDPVLPCQRYIELNPVRARMVSDPAHYRWSSHAGNASPAHDPLLHPHRAWLALGHDPATRRRAWRALVMETVDPQETDAIRLHLQRGLVAHTSRRKCTLTPVSPMFSDPFFAPRNGRIATSLECKAQST